MSDHSTFGQRAWFESVHVGSRHWRDSVLSAASLPRQRGSASAFDPFFPTERRARVPRRGPRGGVSQAVHFHWEYVREGFIDLMTEWTEFFSRMTRIHLDYATTSSPSRRKKKEKCAISLRIDSLRESSKILSQIRSFSLFSLNTHYNLFF